MIKIYLELVIFNSNKLWQNIGSLTQRMDSNTTSVLEPVGESD